MYINKLIKKQVMLILATFVLVGTLAVTASFALFEETKSNATDQKMAIGDLDITFTGGSAISITDINPMTDTVAANQTNNIYTWTITNSGTVPYQFKVKVVNDSDYTTNLLPHQFIRYSLDGGTASSLGSGQADYEIASGVIDAGATNTYKLRLWVADASTYKLPNSALGQEIHLKISVEGRAGDGYLPNSFKDRILADNDVKTPLTTPGQEVSAHVLDDINETLTESLSSTYQAYYVTYGTGWEASGTKFNLTGVTVTSGTYVNSYTDLVGKYLSSNYISRAGSSTAGTKTTTTNLSSVFYVVNATSSSITYRVISSNKNVTEALLASTDDDYGTSYYFRGAVKNNYVKFANKCWRIVRITGDGNVKLVLHNDNISGVSNPCASSSNNATVAFARYSGSTYTSEYNSSFSDNAYIGFMYGTIGSSNYASTHVNTNKSTILTNLETWYKNNLSSYADKLADTIWCNDKNTVSGGLGYSTKATDYNARYRVETTGVPTLKCSNDNDNGNLSKFTVNDTTNGNGNLTYKIGLLTADEIMFSGIVYGAYNLSTYLQENTGVGNGWWSLSPMWYNGSSSGVWRVESEGLVNGYVGNSYGVRPAISLLSTLTVTGTGTSEDPYVVQ